MCVGGGGVWKDYQNEKHEELGFELKFQEVFVSVGFLRVTNEQSSCQYASISP